MTKTMMPSGRAFGILRFGHLTLFRIPILFRASVLVLLLFLAGAANTSAAERWRFIMMCDSRSSSATGLNEPIVRELVGEILRSDVDLVIFAGDLVQGLGTSAARFETGLWNWVRALEPVYEAGIGVYPCRGNHEVGDMWSAPPGQLPNPQDNFALRWLKVFGNSDVPHRKLPDNGPPDERYMSYTVAHKNALIVSLDQYAGIRHRMAHVVNQPWLEAQLAANRKPHVFVFGHEPAFQAMPRDGLHLYPAQRDAFWRSLQTAGVRVYFCGHDHLYDHARIDDGDGNPDNDIHQYIVGTAGAPLYTWTPPYVGNNSGFVPIQVYHAQVYGYVLVEVDGLRVTLTWMERQSTNVSQPGVYQPKDIWTYTAAGCPIKLAADLNGDCRVDFADLALFASEWLASGHTPPPPANSNK